MGLLTQGLLIRTAISEVIYLYQCKPFPIDLAGLNLDRMLDFPVGVPCLLILVKGQRLVMIIVRQEFVKTLEETCVNVIEGGTMTKDLAAAIHGTTQPPSGSFVTTGEFLTAVEMQLKGVYTR